MNNDDGYEEVWAKVRRPEGQRLADSHKTPGWQRGFTARTGENGPQHVEIKFENPPEDTYDQQYGGFAPDAPSQPAREKTPEDREYEEAVQRLIALAIVCAIAVGKPLLLRILDEKVIPFYERRKAAWESRKSRRSKIQAQPMLALESAPSLGDAVAMQQVSMTSEEARRHFTEALIAQHFVNEKMRLLASARIENTDLSPRALEDIRKLSQGEMEQSLMLLLHNDPNLLTNLASGLPMALNMESLSAIPKPSGEPGSSVSVQKSEPDR